MYNGQFILIIMDL